MPASSVTAFSIPVSQASKGESHGQADGNVPMGPGLNPETDSEHSDAMGPRRSRAGSSAGPSEEAVEEDPKLDITFRLVDQPDMSATVNIGMDILAFCDDGQKPREYAVAMGIIRAEAKCTRKYEAGGGSLMNLFDAQCEVSGEEVTGWQGMRGTYMEINNVMASILLQHS